MDERHSAASKWLEYKLSGSEIFALNWQAITAFLCISTRQRSFPRPFTLSEVAEVVQGWLNCENVILIRPSGRQWAILKDVFIEGQATGPLTMDAYLAALAIEHDATLATTDRDFSRFSTLKTIDPLKMI